MKRLVPLLAALGLMILPGRVMALPSLQIYIEGATYQKGPDGAGGEDTWVLGSSDQSTLRVWAIGDIGGKGAIEDVKLAIAYSVNSQPVTFEVKGSNTGGLGGFYQGGGTEATAADGAYNQTGDEGAVPKLSDGKNLPIHGEYGLGVVWQEFLLGDFTGTDYKLADFQAADGLPFNFANPTYASTGEIRVYEIAVLSAATGAVSLHFDLYNHHQAGNKAKAVFAPFSHDGTGTGALPTPVPEPSTVAMALMSLSLLGAVGLRQRRRTEVGA